MQGDFQHEAKRHPLRSRCGARLLGGSALACALALLACDGKLPANVQALPVPEPDLPEVPTLPPPPHPMTYGDGTLSVYGLRRQLAQHLNDEVEVTGHIVGFYEPPKCNEKPCPKPAQPHLWLADTPGETDARKRLTVVGYASHNSDARRRGIGAMEMGTRVTVKGRFAQVSATGFNASNGLLEYSEHRRNDG